MKNSLNLILGIIFLTAILIGAGILFWQKILIPQKTIEEPTVLRTETPGPTATEQPSPSPISPTLRSNSLKNVKFWAYQLQKVHEDDNLQKLIDSHYDLLVIEDARTIADAQEYNMKSAVTQLKNSSNSQGGKKLVIAYVDIGEAEDYRWYWQKNWRIGNPDWVTASDPDGWEGNYPVNYTVSDWKNIIIYREDSYLNQILADGFDGIYMDWIEAYEFNKVYEQIGSLKKAREEMIKFIREIADYARAKKPGFLVIAQNATELGSDSEYLKLLDGIAQESIWYDGEASETGQQGDQITDPELTQEYISNLKNFQKADIPVFSVDYAREKENVDRAYRSAKENGYIPYVSTRQLDKLTDTPPPGY